MSSTYDYKFYVIIFRKCLPQLNQLSLKWAEHPHFLVFQGYQSGIKFVDISRQKDYFNIQAKIYLSKLKLY